MYVQYRKVKRFKPEVEDALLKSEHGEDLIKCANLEDLIWRLFSLPKVIRGYRQGRMS